MTPTTAVRCSPWRGAIIIASVWTIGMAVLVIGELTHARIGFVWPMGQDIDWSLFLKQGIGARAAEQEFIADHRNPLSGWIYSLAAPLILGHDYGFHLLRLMTCLMLGLSIYALAWQLSRGRALYFAVLLGSIVSIWWFWSYFTQVVWMMLFALALSVLVVWSYCVYVDSGRTRGTFYGWSLALWLVALGIYTIQCGAIIPVFLIALFRGPPRNWRETILAAVRDVTPYALIGAAFGAIWITASGGFFADSDIANTTHIGITASALLQSIGYFVWHPSFTMLFREAFADWSMSSIIVVAACVLTISYLVDRLSAGQHEDGALREGTAWMLVVMVCLALPTIVLESTSHTWIPGTRSDMMAAAFIPVLVLTSVALLASVLRPRAIKAWLFVSAALLATAVVLLSLEQNQQAVMATRWQRNLATGLLPLQQASAMHFVVLNSSGADLVGDGFATRFVQDKLNHFPARWSPASVPAESSMRIVEKPEGTAAWPLSIGPDVVTGALYGSDQAVPRSSVAIVRFDGHIVVPLPIAAD